PPARCREHRRMPTAPCRKQNAAHQARRPERHPSVPPHDDLRAARLRADLRAGALPSAAAVADADFATVFRAVLRDADLAAAPAVFRAAELPDSAASVVF